MAKLTLEELANRIERIEAIHRLEAELLQLKIGPQKSAEGGPASMNTRDAAGYLGVSTSTLWELVARGRLPSPLGEEGSRIRLWVRKDLDQYLRNLKRTSPGKVGGN